MISLRLDDKTEKLRTEFLSWLTSHPAPQLPGRVDLEKFIDVSRKWQRALGRDRWVGVHWPEPYGRGLTIVEEAVIQECLAEAGAPQLVGMFGLTMVGPVLIEHGTEAQKKKYLANILSADEIWCQGFSEPQAGSDLAAVRTKAEKTAGNDYEITGQKVWTSFAQVADWCFLLARSNPEAPKYKDLSYFLLSMKTPGIDVRPLTQMTGDKEFNELFFEKVKVPAENIIGSEGDGWKIAISTLMYERVVLTFARHLQSENLLNNIGDYLKERGATPAQKTAFGRLHAQSMAVRALALNHLLHYGHGAAPGPEGSLDKLGWSETFQEICKFGVDILGPDGVLTGGPDAFLDGIFPHEYLYSRGRTIAAGTSEIQRNIIAERVLGLPREGK